MSAEQRFRTDIQGLRALAIIPVLFYHADARLAPGGYVGVDIFFVISGFLITRILLKELDAHRFSIAGFYARRIKRLFPALYTMLAATLITGVVILPPADLADLGSSLLATILFLSNIFFLRTAGYFETAANLKPLLHTWSLAVEEQFYVAFPILLLLIGRFARTLLNSLLWLGTIVSLSLCVFALRDHPTMAFYLPITRAYELLIGSLLAARAIPMLRSRLILDLLSLAGLVLIVFSIAAFDHETLFPGLSALLPCAGAGLILYAGELRQTIGGRILSVPPLVFVGAISYSLYLWHWPILVYLRYASLGAMGPGLVTFAIIAAIVMGTLSWRFIEQPVLQRPMSQRNTLLAGAGMMAIGAAASIAIIAAGGLPQRFDKPALAFFATDQDHNSRRDQCHSGDGIEIAYDRSCIFGTAGARPRTAVWADSFGVELVVAVGERAARHGQSAMQITSSACPPSLGFDPRQRPACRAHNDGMFARLKADHAVRTVILAVNYAHYPVAQQDSLIHGIGEAARGLAAAGKHVVIVYPVPALPIDAPRAIGLSSAWRRYPASFGTDARDFHARNQSTVDALDRLSTAIGAARIVPGDRLCDKEICRAYLPGTGTFYIDFEHLSVTGARYVLAEVPDAVMFAS